MKNANAILLILQALFVYGCFHGNIAFGHGLGDIMYVILAVALFFVSVVWFAIISLKQKTALQKILFVFMLVLFALLMLKATVFRGPEYSWQNHGFFHTKP